MAKKAPTLADLVSVGPATLRDFNALGIANIKELSKQKPRVLYKRLCALTKMRQDPCVEDVFSAAIAQAKDPKLPEEQKHWPYWSSLRKQRPTRCEWVPLGNSLYEHYHDTEWGVPVHDERRHFEFLLLEGAQAGLSWETILKRRSAYADAFAHFDWLKVAAYGPKEIYELLNHSQIIRNRSKIEAAISNARAFEAIRKEHGSMDAYLWQFIGGKPMQPHRLSLADIPTQSKESKALSQDLQKRGFKFVGPTIMYAHMQAIGLINDHTTDCFRFKQLL